MDSSTLSHRNIPHAQLKALQSRVSHTSRAPCHLCRRLCLRKRLLPRVPRTSRIPFPLSIRPSPLCALPPSTVSRMRPPRLGRPQTQLCGGVWSRATGPVPSRLRTLFPPSLATWRRSWKARPRGKNENISASGRGRRRPRAERATPASRDSRREEERHAAG